MISYIETDIDCHQCLEDVRQALIALPDVDAVTENAAEGCLVVTHRTEAARLLEVVTRFGHRLVEADNGEMGMGQVTAVPVTSCAHHPNDFVRGED